MGWRFYSTETLGNCVNILFRDRKTDIWHAEFNAKRAGFHPLYIYMMKSFHWKASLEVFKVVKEAEAIDVQSVCWRCVLYMKVTCPKWIAVSRNSVSVQGKRSIEYRENLIINNLLMGTRHASAVGALVVKYSMKETCCKRLMYHWWHHTKPPSQYLYITSDEQVTLYDRKMKT